MLSIAAAALLTVVLSGQADATIQARASAVPDAITISLWHYESNTTTLAQVVADFQTQYPTITVHVQPMGPVDNLRQKFVQAASAGGGPELVRGPNDFIGPFAAAGLIHPVDGDFDPSLFITETVTGTLWRGQHWAIPDTYGNHLMLLYNKSLLPSAPLSTTEMVSVAKGLTGGGQYGLVYTLNEPFWLIPWLAGFGGWVLDESASPITPTLNTPAMVNALQFVHDLRWVHGVVPSGTVDYYIADDLFQNGDAAMIINGDWALGQYRDHFGDANLGVARIPLVAETGEWPQPMTSGKYYMINANSSAQALAAARLFIQYATSESAQLLWPQNQSVLPALMEAFEDPLV